MIAVTIFCVWLGWQVSIVRERKVVRNSLKGHAFVLDFAPDVVVAGVFIQPQPPPRLSWIREAMGDHSVYAIYHSDVKPAELERVRKAFPEALVAFDPSTSY